MSSRYSRRNQEQFKTQEERLKDTSRFKRKVEFKNQDSRIKLQESRSRFKIQDSRIRRRLNQDKYENFFSKIE